MKKTTIVSDPRAMAAGKRSGTDVIGVRRTLAAEGL
ncbi:hypothetical protein JOF58_004406 [Streptomyces cinnamonensis]|nr:hypothetical protein [Streptomyces virginiae]